MLYAHTEFHAFYGKFSPCSESITTPSMCCTFDCSFTEANLYQSSRYSWQKITTCPVRASSCALRCGLFQHHFFRTGKAQPKMLSSEESASTGNAFLSMVGNGLSVEFTCGFHFHGNFMLRWKISEP